MISKRMGMTSDWRKTTGEYKKDDKKHSDARKGQKRKLEAEHRCRVQPKPHNPAEREQAEFPNTCASPDTMPDRDTEPGMGSRNREWD